LSVTEISKLLHNISPKNFNQAVLKWFKNKGRKDLPWQHNPTSYRVWVSEIMLQQTQVNTVIPYFLKFMDSFPELSDLANASDEQVMAHWSGLGYYSRARNLHKTALLIAQKHSTPSAANLPQSLDELQSLPGIGRSTAGAIVALALQKKAAILDGNVKRVIARCFSVAGWPGKASVLQQLWQLSELLTPNNQIRNYTQAMMDLGATVCTSKNPQCSVCPLQGMCQAKIEGNQTTYPGKKKRQPLAVKAQYFYLLLSEDGDVLMEKRPPTGIWGGLWTPPACDINEDSKSYLLNHYGVSISEIELLSDFRHTFSHFHLQLHPVKARIKKVEMIAENNLRWDKVDNWLNQGIPAAVRTMLVKI